MELIGIDEKKIVKREWVACVNAFFFLKFTNETESNMNNPVADMMIFA